MKMEEGEGYRVKLYELEHSGSWVDRGVGHVTVMMVTELQGPALCILSEETGTFLLQSKIQSDDLYERQGGKSLLLLSSYGWLSEVVEKEKRGKEMQEK